MFMIHERIRQFFALLTFVGLLFGCSLDPKLQDLKLNVVVSERASALSGTRGSLANLHCCDFNFVGNISGPSSIINLGISKSNNVNEVFGSFPQSIVVGETFSFEAICYPYNGFFPGEGFTDKQCAETASSGQAGSPDTVVSKTDTFDPNRDYNFSTGQ